MSGSLDLAFRVWTELSVCKFTIVFRHVPRFPSIQFLPRYSPRFSAITADSVISSVFKLTRNFPGPDCWRRWNLCSVKILRKSLLVRRAPGVVTWCKITNMYPCGLQVDIKFLHPVAEDQNLLVIKGNEEDVQDAEDHLFNLQEDLVGHLFFLWMYTILKY